MTPQHKATLQKLGPFIALLAICAGLSALSADFLTMGNLLNVMRQVSINALIAFGMTLVILLGGIDLSVGSILALSSVLTAMLLQAGVDPLLATLLGILSGALMGCCNGLVISKGKVAPFIATLASMTILRGLSLVASNGSPITGFGSDMFSMLGGGYVAGVVPVPVVWMLLLFAGLWFVLKKTIFGRHVYATGGNEESARLSGVKVGQDLGLHPVRRAVGDGRRGADLAPKFGAAHRRRRLRAGCHRRGGAGRHQSDRRPRLDLRHPDRRLADRRVEQRPQSAGRVLVLPAGDQGRGDFVGGAATAAARSEGGPAAGGLAKRPLHKGSSDMQRLIKPLVFSVIAASLIACTKQGPADAAAGASAPAAASGQPVVGLAVSTLNNPFFVSLRKGAEDEAAKEGVRLITVDAQDDSAKQQASVEDLIQKR